MIRVLAMIAGAGVVVSAVTLTAAVMLAGPGAISDGGWNLNFGGHGGHGWHVRSGHDHGDDGPQTTREIAYTPGDTLDIEMDADVQYTQAPGPAKMTVTGAKGAVEDVEAIDGHVRYHDHDHDGRLTVVISAPSVSSFILEGDGGLTLAAYKQDRLKIDVQGDGEVKGAGETRSLDLDISGSGHARLEALKTADAKVEISGSGDATIAPTASADVQVSGSGDVTLTTDPAKLRSHISGSGEIRTRNGVQKGDDD